MVDYKNKGVFNENVVVQEIVLFMEKFEDIEKARKRLRALLSEIERHNRLYYRENSPEISDFEYDCLQAEVAAIYQTFPMLSSNDGPGSDLGASPFKEFPHLTPMLSLANTYSKDELFNFDQGLSEKIGKLHTYILEPKVDGMAIDLVYESGVFVRALTRGDGTVGEDVTENIKTIEFIPLRLNEGPQNVEVRGEVYISIKDFAGINEEQEKLGLEPFSNARNLASGSVKLLDVAEVKRRRLRFIAHGIGSGMWDSQEHCRQWLIDNNFPVFDSIDKADTIEEVWKFIENFPKIAAELPYKTDGVVLKLNDRNLQNQLGATAKFPRWAIAYKFEPESVETQLKAVCFQVGRTGVVTPVAELFPVTLAGSKISRATLHNFDEIKRKDIQIGDWVVLQKAGEVIPAIIAVNKERRKCVEPIALPKMCPACGAPLIHIDGEVAIRCTSLVCPEQLRLKLVHFASKDAMDIAGLGPKIIDALVQQGWLRHFADIFNLWHHRNVWIHLGGFGKTIVDQLISEIDAAKQRPLWRFLYSLSIPNIGIESAKNLSQKFGSISKIFEASSEVLQTVPLVGPCAAQSLKAFYANASNREIINLLLDQGLMLTVEANIPETVWSGKSFVLTGTLMHMRRSEAKQAIENAGGKVTDVVSSKTFAVIAGDNPGDKLKKAKSLNISVWSEGEFLQYLKNASN